jgi:TIR domain-containing protein
MALPAFNVFLSHRYKSPDINLFFHELFARQAVLQFEVDEGVTFKPMKDDSVVQGVPTNVTRLERMLRGADAFVGIYPISVGATDLLTPEQLKQESRYFRLELDLAVRAGKPALVFYDQRFKAQLACPSGVFARSFDAQEIGPGRQAPSAAAFGNVFTDFCASVSASIALAALKGGRTRSARVGLLLPPAGTPGGYSEEHRDLIEAALRDSDYVPVRLRWPAPLGRELLVECADLDYVVVDVGDDALSAAAVAFLHGRFVPALRLRRIDDGMPETSRLEQALFGSLSVGYPKDIVRWRNADELNAGVRSRIQVIDLPAKRIATPAEAQEYFTRSSKRPVNVFVSYSGRDAEAAARICEALSKRFQKVFNYKDGESIRPGEPWLREIFDQLATAAIALPLISDEYFLSGNCEHEAREIIARRDNQGLHVIPVKLKQKVSVPSWFADIQSERLFAVNDDAEALAQEIARLVDARAHATPRPAGIPT